MKQGNNTEFLTESTSKAADASTICTVSSDASRSPVIPVKTPEYTTASPIGLIRRTQSMKSNKTANSLSNDGEDFHYSTLDYAEQIPLPNTLLAHPRVFLTAVNTAELLLNGKGHSPKSTYFGSQNSDLEAEKIGPINSITLEQPNQFRAFGLRAYSFQKRQWFTNICCISFCPFIIVLTSFALQSIIQSLAINGIDNDYQILYCSNQPSINQQQWPIYNFKAPGIIKSPAKAYPGAKKTIYNFNFLQRAIFFDLSSLDSLNVYSAISLVGSAPCIIC